MRQRPSGLMRPPWRRPDLEGRGPISLTWRRLYILPTPHGLLFSALLAALLWGSANYGLSLGYLFTFLLGSIGTVAMFHTQRNLQELVVHCQRVPPVFAGNEATLTLRIDPGKRDRWGLQLNRDGLRSPLTDIREESFDIRLHLPQTLRGCHPVGIVTLESSHPLGLFRCWARLHPDCNVLVYPAPALSAPPLPATIGSDPGDQGRGAGDESLDTLRPYQPGDSLQRIAWKQAERLPTLVTKQFVTASGDERWLDWNQTPGEGLEERLSCLTCWALEAETLEGRWGLSLPRQRIAPGHGKVHLEACLEALALFGHD